MDILIATRNLGKFKEIQSILSVLKGVRAYSLADLNITEDFEETGKTYEENALGKAWFFFKRAKMLTIADDSGALVEALPGELGVKTRRWGAGADASDEEWLQYFLERMEEEEDRRAKFICVAALVDGESEHAFSGEVEGVLTRQPEAPIFPGIPMSSIFKPRGYDTVYSALSMEEKFKTSHRGQAFQALLSHLQHDH